MRQREKAKATLALLGSPERLSTCWIARVLLEHRENILVLGKRKND